MRRVWILVVVFLCCFLLSACSRAKPNRETQIPLPFAAKIEGTRKETAFCAEISAAPEVRSIRYTAPEALAGLTITESGGKISVRQGDFQMENAPDASGFLAPLDLLLSPAALSALEERNGERTLTYADGTKLILQADGVPRAAIGPDLFFTISNFEITKK